MRGALDVVLRGIYVVLDAAVTPDLETLLDDVLAGGVRIVQYRAKAGVDRELAARLYGRAERSGALFIVNDDLDAVRALPRAGLHVGQEDLAALGSERVRSTLRGRVLGVSCGTAAEARTAVRIGADYVGVGPFAATPTKDDAGPAIGEAGLASVARSVTIPTAAIGGLGLADLRVVRAAGAAMAAVARAVARDPAPREAARRLVAAWAESG